MKKAIFPGSFDPITLGHVDIVERAARLFDEVIVVVAKNSQKQTLLPSEERLLLAQHALSHISNVRCVAYDGLIITFAQEHDACAILRGIRSIKDYEYEQDIAAVNQHLDPVIETVVLFSDPRYAFVSSTIIRELLQYQQDIRAFVSEEVYQALMKKH